MEEITEKDKEWYNIGGQVWTALLALYLIPTMGVYFYIQNSTSLSNPFYLKPILYIIDVAIFVIILWFTEPKLENRFLRYFQRQYKKEKKPNGKS